MNSDSTGHDTAYYASRLVGHVPSLLAYWDRDLRCRFANAAYGRWAKKAPEQLIGMSMPEVLGYRWEQVEPHVRAVLRGEVQVFERRTTGADAVTRYALAHYVPDVVDGKVVGFTVQVTDVTQIKQTEAALREAQRLGQVGGWVWDLPSDSTVWSEELYAILGCDPGQPAPVGAEHARLYAPHSWEALKAAAVNAIKTGEPYAVEVEYRRPDGLGGWLECRGEAVRNAAGKIVKLRGVVIEITARRQGQEARMQRDLAEAASRNKTQFLSRVSHELRTPLNAVLGFAQLSEMDPTLSAKHRQWAAVIMSSGQHMLDLIEDILDLSGAELGHLKVTSVEMDLAALVLGSVAELTALADQSQVSFVSQLRQGAPLRVLGDPRRVRQIVNNLLSNAIKYNRPGGRVTLLAMESGPVVELRVEDTGVGMSAAQLERMFTPFERLGAEATAIKGSGIGLALAKKLVEMMGGTIHVQSQPGAGSAFVVTLPAAQSPA
ncbi:PAS domain-containing sensor histidine kinase [Sphaerotilaceae bacterium SBD11-9]